MQGWQSWRDMVPRDCRYVIGLDRISENGMTELEH